MSYDYAYDLGYEQGQKDLREKIKKALNNNVKMIDWYTVIYLEGFERSLKLK